MYYIYICEQAVYIVTEPIGIQIQSQPIQDNITQEPGKSGNHTNKVR